MGAALGGGRGAEIVSCDSLLFYRGMDIGTAKPTPAERARVPHHLIDILELTETWDVARFVAAARTACEGIQARGRRVLVTGGSGFYLKAFFAPVADEVAVPAEVRRGGRPAGAGGSAGAGGGVAAAQSAGARLARHAQSPAGGAGAGTVPGVAAHPGGTGRGVCPPAGAIRRMAGAAGAAGPAAGGTRCAHRRPRPGDAGGGLVEEVRRLLAARD